MIAQLKNNIFQGFWFLGVASSLFFACGCAVPQTRQISDGTQIHFATKRGTPLPAENEWAKMTGAGYLVVYGQAEPTFFWAFNLIFKNNDVNSIAVSESETLNQLIINEDSFSQKSGINTFLGKKIPLNSKELNWLFEEANTEKIFKIVLKNSSGEEKILYQPAVYSAYAKWVLKAKLDAHRKWESVIIIP